jgi:hypothetical protein
MWIASKLGFFSVVTKRPGQYQVRARVRQDLVNLVEEAGMADLVEILEWPDADYRFRILVNRPGWQALSETLFASVDYPNFKSEVARRRDQSPKLHAYHCLWGALHDLQQGRG